MMFDTDIAFEENYKSFKALMTEKRGQKAAQDKLYFDFSEYAKRRAEEKHDPKAIEWMDMEETIGQIKEDQDKLTLTEWLNRKQAETKEDELKKQDDVPTLDELEKEFEEESDSSDKDYNFSKSMGEAEEYSKKDKPSSAYAYDDDYFKKINEKLRKESRKGHYNPVDYEELARVRRNINKFIGLSDVKKSTEDLIAFAQVQQMKRERGLTSEILNCNAAFMGDPGTGKTTMARQYGELFKALGLLKKGHIIEASRSDLIGPYVGHTEVMTQEVFYEALDGVLFIDEAHNIYDPAQYYDFGHECLSTLIKLMEDFRERVIVIFAGYEDQLERTIFNFEGMESRIHYRLEFKAFKPEEMVAMFDLICVDKKYKISSDVKDSLLAFLKSQTRKSNKLWNGREIRNLFEKALITQARRLSKMTDPTNDQLMTLESSDLELPPNKTDGNIVYL